jgi:hypothetical protein
LHPNMRVIQISAVSVETDSERLELALFQDELEG